MVKKKNSKEKKERVRDNLRPTCPPMSSFVVRACLTPLSFQLFTVEEEEEVEEEGEDHGEEESEEQGEEEEEVEEEEVGLEEE